MSLLQGPAVAERLSASFPQTLNLSSRTQHKYLPSFWHTRPRITRTNKQQLQETWQEPLFLHLLSNQNQHIIKTVVVFKKHLNIYIYNKENGENTKKGEEKRRSKTPAKLSAPDVGDGLLHHAGIRGLGAVRPRMFETRAPPTAGATVCHFSFWGGTPKKGWCSFWCSCKTTRKGHH